MATPGGPLLVFGPSSLEHDFGPGHPLTPRRFGPGIDLLRTLGAEPGLAPEPAADQELEWCHTPRYIRVVRRFSEDPWGLPEAGIGPGDDPPFAGMHEAAASVAGGSIRAMEAILRGDVEHAFQPGGGLHHAMPDRAAGFCVYNDPALAIARARRAGLRVLYLDFDVHHGDGVQAIFWRDPGVLTVSIHESGRYLFPGTGSLSELGEDDAAGTSVNVPLDPGTGESGWLTAVRLIVPELAATFGPDVVVSQHGSDSHAWDPLAHLRNNTTAMGAAARLTDGIAHRWAGGRWLATGGGGYDVYRVVPRAWSLVWLAGAHRETPGRIDPGWRDRWASEAARYGADSLPERFTDEPNLGEAVDAGTGDGAVVAGAGVSGADERAGAIASVARLLSVPALVRAASELGWWDAEEDRRRGGPGGDESSAASRGHATSVTDRPTILERVTAGTWGRLSLAPRVVAPADPDVAHALVGAALRGRDGVAVTAAVDGTLVVALVVSAAPGAWAGTRRILALGVAPAIRRCGIGRRLLAAHLGSLRPGDEDLEALVTVAERDAFEPLPGESRTAIARRLFASAGFDVEPTPGSVGQADPGAIIARRPAIRT